MIDADEANVKRAQAIAFMATALRNHFGDEAIVVADQQVDLASDSPARAIWQAIRACLATAE